MRKVSIKLSDGTTQVMSISDKCKLSDKEIEKNLFHDKIVCVCNDNGIFIDNRFK